MPFLESTWEKHMNLHRFSLQHVRRGFCEFSQKVAAGSSADDTKGTGRASPVGREEVPILGRLRNDGRFFVEWYGYVYIYFHLNIIHIQYIYIYHISIYIYLYTHFLYICNFSWGARKFKKFLLYFQLSECWGACIAGRSPTTTRWKSQTTGKLIWQIEEWTRM